MEHDAFGFAEQAKWEVEGTRRAIKAYREAMARAAKSGSLKALPGSQRILREVVPPLIELIERDQDAAKNALQQKGPPPPWAWLLLLLKAEKLALIAVTHCLRCQVAVSSADGGMMIPLADAISSSVRDEVEFSKWSEQQRADAKAAEAAGDEEHVDLLAVLKARFPALDKRTWAKWRVKVGALREEKWPKASSLALGGHLIGLLLEAAPKHFEKVTVPSARGQAPSYTLRLSAETADMVRDLKTRAEVARPALLPMIIPPLPWVYPEAAAEIHH